MKNKNNKINWGMVLVWTCVYLLFYLIGFLSGMLLQQRIIETGVINVLSYSNLDLIVNFNETKFVQEFNNTIVPELTKQQTIGLAQ